ncbi:unnamed protein product [Lupinus luteus]|uniref:Mitochondrial inner membrane protease subunit 2 n=1 Tax=Lupinus luteus TaxID=3873 RepID=A0AAV1WM06_LUPLU
MGSLVGKWFRYAAHKLQYSVSLAFKQNQKGGEITDREVRDIIWKNFFRGKLTYVHWNKFSVPTIAGIGETFLVRKLPTPDPRHVFVGDLVVLKDTKKPDNYLVRRLTAIEGYEMVSTDEKDEPFVLEKDQCWVVSDNENLKVKEANDSRSFGPANMTDIVGRAVYCMRNVVDDGEVVLQHGPVKNSHFSMELDSPVLAVELDVGEMWKSHRI